MNKCVSGIRLHFFRLHLGSLDVRREKRGSPLCAAFLVERLLGRQHGCATQRCVRGVYPPGTRRQRQIATQHSTQHAPRSVAQTPQPKADVIRASARTTATARTAHHVQGVRVWVSQGLHTVNGNRHFGITDLPILVFLPISGSYHTSKG